MNPEEKAPEEIVEDFVEQIEREGDADELTRGTEVYEEFDDELYDAADDPSELDFEPKRGRDYTNYDFDSVADHIEDYDS